MLAHLNKQTRRFKNIVLIRLLLLWEKIEQLDYLRLKTKFSIQPTADLNKQTRQFNNTILLRLLLQWENTGQLDYLEQLRIKFGIQLTAEQLAAIVTQIKLNKNCRLLVFGLGNDTLLWNTVNRQGKTVFLEDNEQWYNHIKSQLPNISAHQVSYQTKRYEWKKFIHQPEKLQLALEPEIQNTKWGSARKVVILESKL